MTFLPSTADVVVIGGGVIGLSIGYHLAQRGIRPLVVERAEAPIQASVRNAGGIRAQCRNRTERLLAMASIELWEKLGSDTGRDFEYRIGGNLRLATAPETLASLAEESREEEADGLVTQIWESDELVRRAPYLSRRFVGAKYCPTDGHANPILATWTVLQAARSAGATVMTEVSATAIDVDGGGVIGVSLATTDGGAHVATPVVVHAGGAWTPHLGSAIGVEIPIRPARNAMFVTQALPPAFSEFVSSHELGVYARQAAHGHVHVGGVFVVDDTFDQRVTTYELRRLAAAVDIIPGLATAKMLRAWAGTLDVTPDHLPLLGPTSVSGYFLAAGFSGHGFCLGPAVGKVMADLVVDGAADLEIDALHPERFSAEAVGG